MQEIRHHHELFLSDGLEILLQAEEEEPTHQRFDRHTKAAKLRYQASIEELSFEFSRGINSSQIRELDTGRYPENGESILVSGVTGCGKSFLASALGHNACAKGKKVLYFNTPKLLMETNPFTHPVRFWPVHMDQQQRMDFLEIIEDRHGKFSTIIASQLPDSNWHEIIGENTIGNAILDRIALTSHRTELKRQSLRKKRCNIVSSFLNDQNHPGVNMTVLEVKITGISTKY